MTLLKKGLSSLVGGETRLVSATFDDTVPKYGHFQGKSGALPLMNPPTRSSFRGVINRT